MHYQALNCSCNKVIASIDIVEYSRAGEHRKDKDNSKVTQVIPITICFILKQKSDQNDASNFIVSYYKVMPNYPH